MIVALLAPPGRQGLAKTPYDDWQRQSSIKRTPTPTEASAAANADAAARRAIAASHAATFATEAQPRAAAAAAPPPPPPTTSNLAAAANGGGGSGGGGGATGRSRTSSFELKIAISRADLGAVTAALRAGADANAAEPVVEETYLGDLDDEDVEAAVSGGGEFPLIWAVSHSQLAGGDESVQIVQALIDAGADVHQTLPDGETALYVYASRGRTELLAPLKSAGANIDQRETALGETPLFAACRHGHTASAIELIRLGANAVTPTNAKESPLWIASRRGHARIVEALLRAGVPVNTQDEVGEAPLHKAAEYGHLAVLKALLAAGGDPALEAPVGTALAAAEAGSTGEGGLHHGGECEACATLLRSRTGKQRSTTL